MAKFIAAPYIGKDEHRESTAVTYLWARDDDSSQHEGSFKSGATTRYKASRRTILSFFRIDLHGFEP